MNVELQMLIWSVALGLVQVAIATTGMVAQRGLSFAASPRDKVLPPMDGLPGRLDRARANLMETFAFFAAAVPIGYLLQRHTAMTALGAQLYFWSRLVYVPIYVLGIPYVRTLIWTVSVVGIVMLVVPLF